LLLSEHYEDYEYQKYPEEASERLETSVEKDFENETEYFANYAEYAANKEDDEEECDHNCIIF